MPNTQPRSSSAAKMPEDGGYNCLVEIIHRSWISPSQHSVPGSIHHLPLSFFDIPWLLCPPMQRLIFYDLPQYSLLRFTETAIPCLKRSLAIALRGFRPLAGCLVSPQPPGKPHIIFSSGDSVPFTAATSRGDFDELTSDRPQAALLVQHLLPPLPPPAVKDDGTRVAALMAVQMTLFPNSGICIGVQFNHVTADGMAFHMFMKKWASSCKEELLRLGSKEDANYNNGITIGVDKSLSAPVLDRGVVKDQRGLEPILLNQWFSMSSTWKDNNPTPISPSLYAHDKLRATFTMSRSHIDRLKSRITSNGIWDPAQHVSSFVATCAFIWPILSKSREVVHPEISSSRVYHFNFVADCRGRLGYPIPETYFGNCLDICFVVLDREELMGRQGMMAAARAIDASVKKLDMEGGPLRAAEKWLSDWGVTAGSGQLMVVAGSTRLRVYETNFGWGRPRKSLVVQVDTSEGVVSLAESRKGEGGVEVGLALRRASMDAFCDMFEQSLSSFCG
ncbi:hypothetical protein SAY86_022979 [Trapa natans]|uniref:Uncharacterized protein n=1 Tax=Trapa natans TaxID=22666 RepID=A0AAN7R554_TRANT|nr:hypothetical protein SAY86_022979 [Trapa natans]